MSKMTPELKARLQEHAKAKRAKTVLLKDVLPDNLAALTDLVKEKELFNPRSYSVAYLRRGTEAQIQAIANHLPYKCGKLQFFNHTTRELDTKGVILFHYESLLFLLRQAGIEDTRKYMGEQDNIVKMDKEWHNV